MALTWTQADLDRLRQAIADGGMVQSMTFGEQTFTFRSIDDALKLAGAMERAINASSASGQPTTRYGATSKGA